MTEVTVREAKANLSELHRRVEAGEEITIRRGGIAVARLMPIEDGAQRGKRQLGMDAGRLTVPEEFDAPLGDATLDLFGYESD